MQVSLQKRLRKQKRFTQTPLASESFENDFYLLLHTPNHQTEISFLQPHHASQKPIFQTPFGGKGVYLTIEVEDLYDVYKELKRKGTQIKIELRNEVWGDRHFTVVDPNGIGIDIVTYSKPEN